MNDDIRRYSTRDREHDKNILREYILSYINSNDERVPSLAEIKENAGESYSRKLLSEIESELGIVLKRRDVMSREEKSEEVYNFIVDFNKEHGYPPSFRDIADHLGIKPGAVVAHHIRILERDGRILRGHRRARAIKIVGNLENA